MLLQGFEDCIEHLYVFGGRQVNLNVVVKGRSSIMCCRRGFSPYLGVDLGLRLLFVFLCFHRDGTSNLVRMAPMGYETPPDRVRIGKNTFYYYGPGGGGVAYPDGYFFNLRGKILVVDFDGPYENEKTPTPATKKMEQKLLASFRDF